MEQLDKNIVFRCHRSYIINLKYLNGIHIGDLILTNKLINATLVSALTKFKAAWTIDYNFKGEGRHLSICFENAPLHHWHFHYMEHNIDSSIQQHLQKSYLNLIFKDFEPQDKYSFVTSSPSEYEAYRQKPPKNLQLNISVILVKNDTLSIVEETLLQSNHALSKEELMEFTF